MALGRRVEVDLRVGHVVLAAVGAQDALEVAHAHVVGDEGHVLALEALLGHRQVARGRLQRLGGIEALVDLARGRAASVWTLSRWPRSSSRRMRRE